MRYANLNLFFSDKDMKKVHVKQVAKNLAEKAFNKGATVWMHPCNLRLNAYQEPVPVNNKNGESFENVLNHFIYYNCDKERGKYAIFFIENK